MHTTDIVIISLLGVPTAALVLFIGTGIVEDFEDALWPRGLRWLPRVWLGSAERLHCAVLRVLWPEKRLAYKSRALLKLESLDQQWRTWSKISDGGVAQWVPLPGNDRGRWAPREKERPHVDEYE